MKALGRLLIAAAAALLLLHGCAGAPRHRAPVDAHFDGVRFHNTLPADKSVLDILALVATFPFRQEPWPEHVENGSFPPPPPPRGGISATFVNHSTVLLRFDGLNVLTDPIWAERASPFSFLGPRRVREPGLPLDALPPIDVVLVSHDHYDHMDLDTLAALNRHGRDGQPPLVLAGLGTGALLAAHGVARVRELDWWDSVTVGPAEITFAEVRHRSGRGLLDQMKTLWGGFVIAAPGGRVYFTGDSGYGPHFAAARRRYGDFDLALVPIAAYRPRSFMLPVHLDPQAAVRVHLELGARQSVAIHHGTFQLTYEGIDEPYRELDAALAAAAVPAAAFRVLGFGESLRVGGVSAAD